MNSNEILLLTREFKSSDKPVLFVFCRENRSYPCLSVIRDGSKKLQLSDAIPLLAKSEYDLPYNAFKGNTPQGIFTYKGVMPLADNFPDFGEFRRIILDFLPSDEEDKITKSLIPETLIQHSFWKEASLSRDMGRDEFRIHGVGYLNHDPQSLEYPFVTTWGCLTTREGLYDGVTYHDQRLLLDQLMKAQNLEATFENEMLLDGFVVVVNIDQENRKVNIKDLDFLK